MSELITNKITPGTGSSNTITLGDSGDTFTIPAGVTITNSGTATGFGADVITKSTSEPAANTNPSGGVGTLWLRTTTGEMYCCTDATTNSNVWTNIGEGTGQQPFSYMTATGGTITTDGSYKVHSFTASGTFQVTQLGSIATVEYLVVAGGGGGGSSNDQSGGGGAGAMRSASGFTVTATSYSITVGAGGAAHADGLDSVFHTITSDGGGRGGNYGESGNNGGSGGGAGGSGSAGTTTNASYGNNAGAPSSGDAKSGAGGGGAGSVGKDAGANPASTTNGDGGDGLANSITGSAVTYAAGGAGGSHGADGAATGGSSGIGGDGGRVSANIEPTAGDANTGSGGGGGSGSGAAGGSGIVIVRYQFQA